MGRKTLTGCISALLIAALACSAVADASVNNASFEEIVVSFKVQRLLEKDVFVQYRNSSIYLPVQEVFSLLGINVHFDRSTRQVTGYFIHRNDRYSINIFEHRAETHLGSFELSVSDVVVTPTDVFIRLEELNRLFGLDLQFDFSRLQVFMRLNQDLPAYQKLQRQLAHEKLRTEKVSFNDVSRLPLRRDYIGGGVVDWTLSANPLGDDQYYDFTAGGLLFGGDFTITGSGNTVQGFNSDQADYRWHYFVDQSPYVTQLDLGDVYTTGPLTRSLRGGMITNRPQVRREYFQTIQVSGKPGEGWEVELYVDNRLTDYAYTDENGEYRFDIDIVYGSSLITIKKYGPNGEIETEDQYIRIPYTLIPKGDVEYTVAGGDVESSVAEGVYAQATGFYGVLDNMTVGLAVDAPVANASEDAVPLVAGDITYQPMSNLTFNTAFSPNNEARLSANYSKPSVLNVNASVSKYFENPIENYLQRRYSATVSASAPFRVFNRYFSLRASAHREAYPSVISTNVTYGFTASVWALHFNYLGNYKRSEYSNRTGSSIASQLIASIRAINWIRPQIRVDYDHTAGMFTRYGIYASKRVFKTAQLAVSFERNEISQSNQITASLNFFTDFLQATSRVTHSDRQTHWSQVQRGSVVYDDAGKNFRFERRSSVGYGSAVVRPFHDRNFNGRFDSGESYLDGLKADLEGTGGRQRRHDRMYYYDHLRAYDDYIVRVDEYSLDNPLLKPSHKNYQITVSPNRVTEIAVPIVSAAEISGSIMRVTDHGPAPLGGVKILLLNLTTESVTEITSFNDGEFYYLGLLPGNYKAYIDPGQLERSGYEAVPGSIEFQVEAREGGAIVQDIDFTLRPTADTSE